jgi:hypothetical protein
VSAMLRHSVVNSASVKSAVCSCLSLSRTPIACCSFVCAASDCVRHSETKGRRRLWRNSRSSAEREAEKVSLSMRSASLSLSLCLSLFFSLTQTPSLSPISPDELRKAHFEKVRLDLSLPLRRSSVSSSLHRTLRGSQSQFVSHLALLLTHPRGILCSAPVSCCVDFWLASSVFGVLWFRRLSFLRNMQLFRRNLHDVALSCNTARKRRSGGNDT